MTKTNDRTSGADRVAPDALNLRSVSKTFGSHLALDSLDLTIRPGEIHALIGQNGSGKSTVVKLLGGYHEPDKGSEAHVNGQELQLGSITAAKDAGLRFVHQDLGLVDHFSVAENFFLTNSSVSLKPLSKREERLRSGKALRAFGYDIDPRSLVADLSAAQRTVVAIVRALSGDTPPALLILDEPTAALPGPDAELLFAALRRLAASGASVLLISHHLDEIVRVSDMVTVLRDGRKVADAVTADLTHERLAELMLGRAMSERPPVSARIPDGDAAPSKPRLVLKDLRGSGMNGLNLGVQRGEIVGVTGLTGSGRENLAGAVSGQIGRAGGVFIDGVAVKAGNPRAALNLGLAYAPAERRRDALLSGGTLRENLTISHLGSVSRRGRLVRSLERRDARKWIEKLDVRPCDDERMVLELSGGNQQKIVLGRLLRTEPIVLVLDEPTQGVDVGAKAAIHDLVQDIASTGASVVVCSSDVEELVRVSTRVVVMVRGVVSVELTGSSLTAERIEEELLRPTASESTLAATAETQKVETHA